MENLHVFLFPFMAQGHMIPILDIAKLFSYRGVRSTIITTPLNSHFFTRSIPESGKLSSQSRIDVLTIRSQLYSQTVTDILKIGAGVGALQRENREEGVGVRKEEIMKAVEMVMVGEEAEEIRNRAKGLKTKAKTAIEEGGSSHSYLNALIHELSSHSL